MFWRLIDIVRVHSRLIILVWWKVLEILAALIFNRYMFVYLATICALILLLSNIEVSRIDESQSSGSSSLWEEAVIEPSNSKGLAEGEPEKLVRMAESDESLMGEEEEYSDAL